MAQSFFNKGQAWTNSYNRKSAPEVTWEYRQASFHHAHMIRVRYFDNLICGWTGAWYCPYLDKHPTYD